MKKEEGIMIALNSELASYFKTHPEQLPAMVDADVLEVKCQPFVLAQIEAYVNKPFNDKSVWSMTFPGSRLPDFQYKYLVTYQTKYMGESGVVAVDMVYEKLSDPRPWYLDN